MENSIPLNAKKIKVCCVANSDVAVKFLLLSQLKFLVKEKYDVYVVCSDGKWISDIKKAGIKASDLKKVLIAGGFGSFIRRNHAQRIGLLPADISREKISFIGNSSLAGAKLALLSMSARQKAQTLASQTQHIELSIDSDFQNEFASAMIFPAKIWLFISVSRVNFNL